MRCGSGSSGLLLGGAALIALLARVPAASGQLAVKAGPGARAQAAVATESARATREAAHGLRSGGNAIDAAVIAALVAGVTSPSSSGIGGGGFALSWDAASRRVRVLDFRETAPRALTSEAFEGRPFPANERGRLVGVPGELKGLFELHRGSGRLPWAEVVAPAIAAARKGYSVGPHLAAMLAAQHGRLSTDPAFARLYYPGGRPLGSGAWVRNGALARLLARVAAEGPAAVYEGPVAAEIVETARGVRGDLALADLATYQAVERQALEVEWEGYRVFTMPLPSAGGVMVGQVLRSFGRAELVRMGSESGAYQHLLAEAMRAALADRMRQLGDPDPSVQAQLLDVERVSRRRGTLSIDRTHAVARFTLDRGGTHHLVTSDADGNMVSLTTTVNTAFGAKLMTPNGIVLNDELDDFTSSREVAVLGLAASPNRARPGARPISSMTPTIAVRDGAAVMGVGGSGGPAIATNVTQAVLARLAFGMTAAQIASRPRFYVPTSATATLWLEPEASPALRSDLEWRGERVALTPFTKSAVQIVIRSERGVEAAADPRKSGLATAW